jgi:hypothetical protein
VEGEPIATFLGDSVGNLVTVHSGPCEEDGSCMWRRVFYHGRDPLSKGALDTGGRKVIKKDKNQTIALAVGTKTVTQSGMGSRATVLKTAGCSSRDKMVYWRCSSNIFGYQLFDH